MSQASSTSTSGDVIFGNTGGGSDAFPLVALIVAAVFLAFVVFRKTR